MAFLGVLSPSSDLITVVLVRSAHLCTSHFSAEIRTDMVSFDYSVYLKANLHPIKRSIPSHFH